MFPHIDTLTRADDPEHEIFEYLCREILDRSFSIVVTRIRPSHKEKQLLKERTLVPGRGVWVFSFTHSEQVVEIMHLISIARPLHISRMQIIIGTADLPAAIREKYGSVRLSGELVWSGRWLQGMEELIAGGIDPLDNDLSISGNQLLRESTNRVLQSREKSGERR